MPRPFVIAYHLIWTAYGWWLPNDPRGSTSRTIRNDILAELGELHYGRKKAQPVSAEIRRFYRRAKDLLRHPLLEFSRAHIAAVGTAFAEAVSDNRYTCYACAVVQDHVHVLIRKHRHKAEEMIANLQDASRLELQRTIDRYAGHPVWGGEGWKVFLDSPDDIRRTVRYIEGNPPRHGLPAQQWPFVKTYDGWPLHPGHDPNSPYARRLRGAKDG
jgi:REP element-mobilizing transposase RayT